MARIVADAWYWFVRAVVKWGFFRLGGGFAVRGANRVPRSGGLIVAANHVSNLDPPALACSLPRRLTFMAKEELFKGLFGSLIGSLGAFPIRRGVGDMEAIRSAVGFLEGGHALMVLPEGTRGDGLTLLPFTRGVEMLARKTGALIVPVGIVGTQRRLPRGASKPRFGRVIVAYGEPYRYSDVAGPFTPDLERRIIELCRANGYEVKSASSSSPSQGASPRESPAEGQTLGRA